MMPSQDGWQILQQLKSLREARDIPIIVCSVLRERALALSLGAADFLVKPITQQALLSALAKHCGSSAPAPPAGSPSPRRPIAPRGA
jgi:CheY-like chemotaxis protein